MKLTLATFHDPAAFAAAFDAAGAAEIAASPLSAEILAQLRSGPATWFRLQAELCRRHTRLELDSALAGLLASGQIVRLDHVGGFRYGLPDSPVSPTPQEG